MSDTPTTNPLPTGVLYCANHPTVETALRCNRCEKPICPKCAVSTPTGYRCRECVRGQQKTFETAQWWDAPLAFGVALVLGVLGSLIASVMGFFVLLIAPATGVIIAEVVRFVVRKRRSQVLFLSAAAGAVIGSLPFLLIQLLAMNLWGLALHGFFTVTVGLSVYQSLKGINLR